MKRGCAAFRPKTMGVFVLLIMILALGAGFLRNELVLFIAAAVLLCVWLYCLVFTLILALLNRKRAYSSIFRISPAVIVSGEETAVCFTGGAFFRFPAILVRCAVNLQTGDGKTLRRVFEPGRTRNGMCFFTVRERGAYHGSHDEVLVMDSLGFFVFSFRIGHAEVPPENAEGGSDARLLVTPRPLSWAAPVNALSGGEERRSRMRYQRTDNFIEHRPYVPGDDPRRINWKLYSHHGELFVRQGEPEPPPHSRLTIVLDTQADPLLYTKKRGRLGADLICEYALRAALDCVEKNMELRIAWLGGTAWGKTAEECAAIFAYPFSMPLKAPDEFFSGDMEEEDKPGKGCLFLALPRAVLSTPGAALDRFLARYGEGRDIEILFLCGEDDAPAVSEAGLSCVSFYGQKGRARARLLRREKNGDGRYA